MKAQVLTTTSSALSGDSAATMPSATSVPANLSESTWFFGQPNVSIQYRSATWTIYRPNAAGNGEMAPDAPLDQGIERCEGLGRDGRWTFAPVLTHVPSWVDGVTSAEREGFEPSDPVTQVNSLAVSPIRPLSHLSVPGQRYFLRLPTSQILCHVLLLP